MSKDKIERLRLQIAKAEEELSNLKSELASAEAEALNGTSDKTPWKWPLAPHEYDRYGRQLILSQVGLKGA